MLPYSLLTDGQVTLRPFQYADVSELYAAVRESLAELKPWMSWAHDGYSQREARDFVALVRASGEEGILYGFAITDAKDGSISGSCSLSHFHPVYRFCNLGYWVRTSRQGRGIASRAALLAARFAVEQLKLIRVEVVVAAGNAPSLRVAEKIGAHREGLLRNRITVGATLHDAVMFSFIPEDFTPAVRPPSSNGRGLP
ncbi:MAG: GNAT family N-acetyltransferase [Bacteroidota bacterium]